MNNFLKRPTYPKSSGFTLVELMVVILIIGILSGIVLTAMGGDNTEGALDGGISQTRSLFSLARSGAIARKVPMRVLVHADPSDPDRYLQYFTIVYVTDDKDTPETTDDDWAAYTQGEYLPDGIYFSPGMSAGDGSSQYLKKTTFTFNPSNLNFTNPGPVVEATASLIGTAGTSDPIDDKGPNVWFVYEFNPNGTYKHPIGRVVLASGLLDGDVIRFTGENPAPFEQARGFVLFRTGKPMFFQDADQIDRN